MFEWRWTDIAQECERFLGPYGYCGVQPVSYKLVTRSGTEAELKDMIDRCNRVNVRIFADVVVNHMTGVGGSGTGTGGTYYDAGKLSYPGVPFSSWDFNDGAQCHTGDLNIHNYQNAEEVRNCRLVNLADLKLSKDYVRDKIAEFLNHLIDLGVGGFRFDAAKHMWPGDLLNIVSRLHNLNTRYFTSGTRPFAYQEVIDQGGEPIKATEYVRSGRVTDFIYGIKLSQVMRKQNQAKWLKTWGEAWGMPNTNDAVVFIDNHDNQRGHGGGGGVLTHFEPRPYKLATAFINFVNGEDHNNWEGPPHNGDMSTKHVCEHRWRQIYNMVAFRNVVMGTNLHHWWDNGNYQIAFARGNKGFFILNLEGSTLDRTLQTGLPQGTYCDIITGNYINGQCTGGTINVGSDGNAHFHINGNSDDPMIGIHIVLIITGKLTNLLQLRRADNFYIQKMTKNCETFQHGISVTCLSQYRAIVFKILQDFTQQVTLIFKSTMNDVVDFFTVQKLDHRQKSQHWDCWWPKTVVDQCCISMVHDKIWIVGGLKLVVDQCYITLVHDKFWIVTVLHLARVTDIDRCLQIQGFQINLKINKDIYFEIVYLPWNTSTGTIISGINITSVKITVCIDKLPVNTVTKMKYDQLRNTTNA
ncbi:hypothetical protein KUTeg_000741 [Tegillarca granosa]|uniref:alpha-amylase n=1 Tax=Tegillarca granosa TaxID=220873 RepID=A0ABQ9G188_TEGGR|nr:hypothetical protein KUTeg_000741 [Tegillarca granosa]